MPLLPYASTGDTVTAVSTALEVSSDGFATVGGQPFSGLASQVYDLARPERMHLRFRFRDGLKDGPADGWDEERNRIYGALYEKGELAPGSESWNGKGGWLLFWLWNRVGSGRFISRLHLQPWEKVKLTCLERVPRATAFLLTSLAASK